MNRKRRRKLVTTGLMALMMCGIMSLLVTAINQGFRAAMILPWLRNWVIAIAALFPVAYFVTPSVSARLQCAGLRGQAFHILRAVILGCTYALWMTFVMAAVNVGFTERFLSAWMRSFRILAGIAAVLLYLLTPPVQKLAGKLCGDA